MMAGAKQKRMEAGSDVEFKYWFRSEIVDAVAAIIQALVRYCALALIVYFLYRTVGVLAGKQTFTDIGIRMLGNLRLSETVGWTFGAGGVLYGWKQRKLRHDKTEYLQERIRTLEEGRDPQRSSSRLTRRGTTNPEDQDG